MKISEALRMARAAKKMKQHELAAMIGVSQQMVSGWENDSDPVSPKNWQAILEALGVDCSQYEMPQTQKSAYIATGHRGTADNGGTVSISGDIAALNYGHHATVQAQLTEIEYDTLMLFRRYGNPHLLEKCRQSLLRAKELFD